MRYFQDNRSKICPISFNHPHSNSSYPRNLQLTGPTSNTRAANASPSLIGGGAVNFSRLTNRHVILVGILARFGGIITLTPECRHPRMAPPRASTKKLTKNLNDIFESIPIDLVSLNMHNRHLRAILKAIPT